MNHHGKRAKKLLEKSGKSYAAQKEKEVLRQLSKGCELVKPDIKFEKNFKKRESVD